MGLFGNGKKRQERRQHRKEKIAARREFKLAKKAIRLENKEDRRSNRTERAHGRQDTRLARTDSRQSGKTDRTQIRKDARVAIKESQNEADMVAYENGMQPINRTAGIIAAGGHAASGLADLATSLAGAGVFGNDSMILNSGAGRTRDIEIDEDGGIRSVSDKPSMFGGNGNNFFLILIAGIVAVFAMMSGNRNRRR